MKRSTMLLGLILAVALVGSALATPTYYRSGVQPIHSDIDSAAKATRDTVVLIGPWNTGAQVNGQFQTATGTPAWNGWTHTDLTKPTTTHWQLSTYSADNLPGGAGNIAAWCGDPDLPACSEEDPVGGYGPNYTDMIEFFGTVSNPTQNATVNFTAAANIDSETGYDYTYIRYNGADGWVDVASYDGTQSNITMEHVITLEPTDYKGPGSNQVHLAVVFDSDGATDDEDCRWQGTGGVQIDDISVVIEQAGQADVTSLTDFESGWGDWTIGIPDGVGDFSDIWTYLPDIDPCNTNNSPQVAFIDNGEIVPGAGPSICQDWCYGPGGYIVNTTGGLIGPDEHLNIVLESPVLAWPGDGYGGALLRFDVYRHEDLSVDSPGIFYLFAVRSTDSAAPADIEDAPWVDRNGVYYGGPDYFREFFPVSDLIVPGATYAQVQLMVWEVGFAWGWDGDDGYPAPYFDNVRFIAYPRTGPSMATDELDLANDNFPEIGELDLLDLSRNSVRFDMGRNISPAEDLRNDPGDSLRVEIAPGRAGASLVGAPVMNWIMKPNPIFDAYRTSELGTATSGSVAGINVEGTNDWAFDLPDSNFLFPGDVLHYNFVATDAVDGMDEQTSILPGDQTGFGDFSGPLTYFSTYTMRALPTVYEHPNQPGVLTNPKTLFWNDFANRGGEEEWHGALAKLGLVMGEDYDTYYTNRPDAGDGNGLGGRATRFHLSHYDNMLYSCGDLTVNTIANGDFAVDPSDDVTLLANWLTSGHKNLFLTGDNLVSDLYQSGSETVNFVDDWMKVLPNAYTVRPLLNNQSTPQVAVETNTGVFLNDYTWVAYGGCDIINTFDAVTANSSQGGERLAQFMSPAGGVDVYTYSACTMFDDPVTSSCVISMPYDFMEIYDVVNGDKAPASLPMRARVLESILAKFGVEGDPGDVTGIPEAQIFAVSNYPNPFNPTTRIEYTMPRAGHLSLKVFNLRGELVKTLIDGHQDAGSNHVMWDGSNDQGAKVSSGVYFYEARTGDQVKVQKMALVK